MSWGCGCKQRSRHLRADYLGNLFCALTSFTAAPIGLPFLLLQEKACTKTRKGIQVVRHRVGIKFWNIKWGQVRSFLGDAEVFYKQRDTVGEPKKLCDNLTSGDILQLCENTIDNDQASGVTAKLMSISGVSYSTYR